MEVILEEHGILTTVVKKCWFCHFYLFPFLRWNKTVQSKGQQEQISGFIWKCLFLLLEIRHEGKAHPQGPVGILRLVEAVGFEANFWQHPGSTRNAGVAPMNPFEFTLSCHFQGPLREGTFYCLEFSLPLWRSAVFVTCTSSFLWKRSKQCTPEADMDQKVGFIWKSLFLPFEMWRKVLGIILPSILKGLCKFSQRYR